MRILVEWDILWLGRVVLDREFGRVDRVVLDREFGQEGRVAVQDIVQVDTAREDNQDQGADSRTWW